MDLRDEHKIPTDLRSARAIDTYQRHKLYMDTLNDLLGDTSNEVYNAVRYRLAKRDYTLNLRDYQQNPFFLGYCSARTRGILVHGRLLEYKDLANIVRQ